MNSMREPSDRNKKWKSLLEVSATEVENSVWAWEKMCIDNL